MILATAILAVTVTHSAKDMVFHYPSFCPRGEIREMFIPGTTNRAPARYTTSVQSALLGFSDGVSRRAWFAGARGRGDDADLYKTSDRDSADYIAVTPGSPTNYFAAVDDRSERWNHGIFAFEEPFRKYNRGYFDETNKTAVARWNSLRYTDIARNIAELMWEDPVKQMITGDGIGYARTPRLGLYPPSWKLDSSSSMAYDWSRNDVYWSSSLIESNVLSPSFDWTNDLSSVTTLDGAFWRLCDLATGFTNMFVNSATPTNGAVELSEMNPFYSGSVGIIFNWSEDGDYGNMYALQEKCGSHNRRQSQTLEGIVSSLTGEEYDHTFPAGWTDRIRTGSGDINAKRRRLVGWNRFAAMNASLGACDTLLRFGERLPTFVRERFSAGGEFTGRFYVSTTIKRERFGDIRTFTVESVSNVVVESSEMDYDFDSASTNDSLSAEDIIFSADYSPSIARMAPVGNTNTVFAHEEIGPALSIGPMLLGYDYQPGVDTGWRQINIVVYSDRGKYNLWADARIPGITSFIPYAYEESTNLFDVALLYGGGLDDNIDIERTIEAPDIKTDLTAKKLEGGSVLTYWNATWGFGGDHDVGRPFTSPGWFPVGNAEEFGVGDISLEGSVFAGIHYATNGLFIGSEYAAFPVASTPTSHGFDRGFIGVLNGRGGGSSSPIAHAMVKGRELFGLRGFTFLDVVESLPSEDDVIDAITDELFDKIKGLGITVGCTYNPSPEGLVYYVRWTGSKWIYGVKQPGEFEIKEMPGTQGGGTPNFDFYFGFSPVECRGPDGGITSGWVKGNAFVTEAIHFGRFPAIGLRQ